MQKGIDYDETHTSCLSARGFRTILAIAASDSLTLGTLDVRNAFQNTQRSVSERVLLTPPPFYLEWFNLRYPHLSISRDDGPFCLQAVNGIQGTKDIGRVWNIVLRKILMAPPLEFTRLNSEPGVFVKHYPGNQKHIIGVSTDDFLCAYSDRSFFLNLIQGMKSYFNITSAEGPSLRMLNIRIIQSEHGVSFDQSEGIEPNILCL